MKTTINLTIHAPSKEAAKFCLEYLLTAWDALHRSGEAPANTFLGLVVGAREYGKPKGIRHGKKKK